MKRKNLERFFRAQPSELHDTPIEDLEISRPKASTKKSITSAELEDAPISGGKILFRGDSRPPRDLFNNGIRAKERADLVLDSPFASKQGAVIALTPYLNTAAVFPMLEGVSQTWVYIIKIHRGMPIAEVSMNILRDDPYAIGSPNYPAEIITHNIKADEILYAVLIERNVTSSWQGIMPSEPSGTFKILEIHQNPKANADALKTPYLQDYIKTLEEDLAARKESQLALKAETYQLKLNSELGLADVSKELIAQNSLAHPKEAVERWLNVLQMDSNTFDASLLNEAALLYPQMLSILNSHELNKLLSLIGTVNNSPFFEKLKGALAQIIENAGDETIVLELIRFFIHQDTEGKFVFELFSNAKLNALQENNVIDLLMQCHANKSYQDKLLHSILKRIPTLSYKALGTVLGVLEGTDRFGAPLFEKLKGMLFPIIKDTKDSSTIRELIVFSMKHLIEDEILFRLLSDINPSVLQSDDLIDLSTQRTDNKGYQEQLSHLTLRKLETIGAVGRSDLALIEHLFHQTQNENDARKQIRLALQKIGSDKELSELVNEFAEWCPGFQRATFFRVFLDEIKRTKGKGTYETILNPMDALGSQVGFGSRRIKSPILSAIKQGDLELVTLYVQSGVNLITEVTPTGRNTPLMTAIRYNQPDIVSFILNQADQNAAPIDFAQENRDRKTALDLLQDKKECVWAKKAEAQLQDISYRRTKSA